MEYNLQVQWNFFFLLKFQQLAGTVLEPTSSTLSFFILQCISLLLSLEAVGSCNDPVVPSSSIGRQSQMLMWLNLLQNHFDLGVFSWLSLVSEGTEDAFGDCVIQHTAWWRASFWSSTNSATVAEDAFLVCVLQRRSSCVRYVTKLYSSGLPTCILHVLSCFHV